MRLRGAIMFEALEIRRLLSSGSAAAIDVVGQYGGSAQLVFSPRKSHPGSADSVSLTISSQSPKGFVSGVLTDSLGFDRQVAGRLRRRHLTLHLTSDEPSRRDRGQLVGTVTADGLTFAGRLRELQSRPKPALSWAGPVTLHRLPANATPQMPVQQGPAPRNLLGMWVGTLSGTRSELLVEPTTWAYSSAVTLTITSQNPDGTLAGTSEGFDPFFGTEPAPINGVIGDNSVKIKFPNFASQPATAGASSDWKTLTGQLFFSLDGSYDWVSGDFTLQRVQWPTS